MARLLVVDDEKSMCQMLEIAFRKDGHQVETALSVEAARRKLESQLYDVAISDIRMPDQSGIALLKSVKTIAPETYFLLVTAYANIESAIQAVNLGAYRYIIKTDKLIEELSEAVQRALTELALRRENVLLRKELSRRAGVDKLIGNSSNMRAIFELIQTLAETSSTVLVTGESGTGKELVARAIHVASPRRSKPFVAVNCGAFPETLLESELFGYLKGAFTGANTNKTGLFEAAHGGTIFLDEIGETSPAMQVKLLRVLQNRCVRPLGGTEDVAVDVRVIASTNRDLRTMTNEGKFREDLYYRVSVIPLRLPALRERKDDIELLARHFIEKSCRQMNRPVLRLHPKALKMLKQHEWPGNVRELENVIERVVALTADTEAWTSLERLREAVLAADEQSVAIPPGGLNFEKRMAEMEKQYLARALMEAGGLQTKAAELLGMSYRSFRHYAKKYKI